MPVTRLQRIWWCVLPLTLGLAGGGVIVRAELGQLREAFYTDARIAHRLLSQRVAQHDAILATLALMAPAMDKQAPPQASPPELRLPAVYPQILQVLRRGPGEAWASPALDTAEAQARQRQRAQLALGGVQDGAAPGTYVLVAGAGEGGYALRISLPAVVPWDEWPMPREGSPTRVTVALPGQAPVVLQAGGPPPGGVWPGLDMVFEKNLSSDSQGFVLEARRQVGWAELPWLTLLGWWLLMGLGSWAWRAWRRQTVERRRAEELLRLGQVARLNTLGELAAGMAHELNQPLTALLANTQAVSRLLRDEPPDLALVQRATDDAVQQARRAADVVGRLRRAVERPDVRTIAQPMALEQPLRSALHLLEPEFRRRQVLTQVESDGAPQVMADPVAVEQIVHNLLMNALHALEQVPVDARRIRLWLGVEQGQGVLRVTDSGPGIAADVLPRLFQPFFSTRPGGMGLGLSLCETLATGMGGALTAASAESRGAVFTLRLPLVTP